jgi:hypothetical protein
LDHESLDDAMELAASVSEALFASGESTEVLSSLGNNFVEQVEIDATGLL